MSSAATTSLRALRTLGRGPDVSRLRHFWTKASLDGDSRWSTRSQGADCPGSTSRWSSVGLWMPV